MAYSPVFAFSGSCSGNCQDGKGEFVSDDGVYDGTWKDGLLVQGKHDYPNGDSYTGHFVNGLPEGQGTMTYGEESNFGSYTGSWKAGKRSGQGTMTYSDGTTYKGSWKDDVRHGKGITAEANGKGKTKVVFKDGTQIK